MHPILFEIHKFQIGTYGTFVATAIAVAMFIVLRQGAKDSLEAASLLDLAIALVFAGAIGARIGLFVVNLSRGVPLLTVLGPSSFRAGGVIHGGILLAIPVFFWRLRKHRLPLAYATDAIAPAVPMGQAIGRLGCFFAGCCYGTTSKMWWSVTFHSQDAHRLYGTPLGEPLHPIQFYIFFTDLGISLVLMLARKRRRFPGQLFAGYFLLEGIGRIIMETWRADSLRGVGYLGFEWLSTGRLSGILLLAIGAGIWAFFSSSEKKIFGSV